MKPERLCFVTLPVSDLEAAIGFYTEVLGFSVSRRYPATRWVSLDIDETAGGGLGLMETPTAPPPEATVRLDLFVRDLDALWLKLDGRVTVEHAPRRMPWGSYKAVIRDPFGTHLGLVQAPEDPAP